MTRDNDFAWGCVKGGESAYRKATDKNKCSKFQNLSHSVIPVFNTGKIFSSSLRAPEGRGNPWTHLKDGLLPRVFDPFRNDEKT